MFCNPIKLEIDGVIIRSPSSFTRKREPIWSKNTGRTASQRMQGTIKAIKETYSIKWPPLTQWDQELIESLVSNQGKPFHKLKVTRPDGSVKEMECYFGTPSFTEWVWLNGQWMATDATVDAIER